MVSVSASYTSIQSPTATRRMRVQGSGVTGILEQVLLRRLRGLSWIYSGNRDNILCVYIFIHTCVKRRVPRIRGPLNPNPETLHNSITPWKPPGMKPTRV